MSAPEQARMDFDSIDESKVLAAAATTVVCLKCTTLDVQHRKPSFALSATFAARLAHLACAVDAVHSDVSTSRHAAKHRASSSAA